MAKPTAAAEAGVKHAILYLKGTPDLGILLGYQVSSNSKLDEVRGDPGTLEAGTHLVEAFTDADWAVINQVRPGNATQFPQRWSM